MTNPIVYIDGFHKISGEPNRVILLVSYAGKEARIELPEAAQSTAHEPGVEAYRREIHQIAQALLEAAAEPQGIRWRYYPPREQP